MKNGDGIETHPFGNFVPPKAKYLILGSFTGKEAQGSKVYNWFYGTKRNQFWPIIESVYSVELADKTQKQKLFAKLRIGLADIIYQCQRTKNSNLDVNLKNIVYNTKGLENILVKNKIEKIFFTSRFVETKFRRVFKHLITSFPDTKLITLPSPSPRYAQLTKQEKVKIYRRLLPRIED